MISTQVWRIPQEKISINMLSERPEEAVRVYAKDNCSIPAGMGKYILVQTNCEITGKDLIKIDDKTISGLVLPEIVYNVKKKLGCIFVESIPLKTKGLVTSCAVTQEEQGQTPVECSDSTQSVTARSNDTET